MAPQSFCGTIHRRWIDDLLIVDFESSGFGARFHLDSAANDYVGFGISPKTYGECVTLRNDRVVDSWRTEYFWDNAAIREYVQLGPGRTCLVFIPRSTISANSRRLRLNPDLRDNSSALVPAARMLKAMVASLRDHHGLIEPRDAVGIRNAMVELVGRLAVRAEPPMSNAAVSSAMRHSVETWIDRQLASGPVTTTAAAGAHGISERSLHRLFEGTGTTFASLVRSARVARARADVIGGGDSFQAIAMRWGFSDASHFSREFRRFHGMSPREARAEALDT
jgi:AraC-like DNA-binding protein